MAEKMTITLGGGVKMDFVLIRPGSFMMGSEKGTDREKPVHQVTLTKPFYTGVYEVTQAQWKAVMGDNPVMDKSISPSAVSIGDDLPVVCVSWDDCQRFLEKLKEKVGAGQTGRLPTEAEWEYACRAGSKTEYCSGDDEGRLSDYAWFGGYTDNKAHPVGQKKPNAWGLYDMHGNVSEWCADRYGDYSADGATDPQGAPSGSARVYRGGSSGFPAMLTRSAYRYMFEPSNGATDLGFRLVVSAQE